MFNKLKTAAVVVAASALTSVSAFAEAVDPTAGVTLLSDTQTSNITSFIAASGAIITGVCVAWVVVHLGVSGFKALRGAVKGA